MGVLSHILTKICGASTHLVQVVWKQRIICIPIIGLIIWPGWKYETKLFFLLQKIISHTEQKPIIRKQIGFWKTFRGPLLPLSMFQMYCQRKWFPVLCLPRQSSAAWWCLISMEFASVNSLADHINELDNKTALSELLATFVYLKVEHFFKFRTRLTTICDWYIEFREHVHI